MASDRQKDANMNCDRCKPLNTVFIVHLPHRSVDRRRIKCGFAGREHLPMICYGIALVKKMQKFLPVLEPHDICISQSQIIAIRTIRLLKNEKIQNRSYKAPVLYIRSFTV